MIFARLGLIVAWVCLVFGAMRLAFALLIVGEDDPARRAEAAARYLFTSTTGEAIDRGIYTIVFGIALGILASIGLSIAKRDRNSV